MLLKGADAKILGALVAAARQNSFAGEMVAYGAVVLATINVVGGFLVTDRMLSMFKQRRKGSSN